MTYIQTVSRNFKVKETYEQVCSLMDLQWFELTEDCSFYGEMTGKIHQSERRIKVNRDLIVEIYTNPS